MIPKRRPSFDDPGKGYAADPVWSLWIAMAAFAGPVSIDATGLPEPEPLEDADAIP